ncbi:MAG: peptidyl-prolyl cis-trans isomerase, FKBP-type, 22 kDa subunit, partial [Sediminibacterium sp.]|nr:peptidyl-prolyl cis-trans isomerase, FKBP-type, 22 kDa subunit [Sediminibacterium sp.]
MRSLFTILLLGSVFFSEKSVAQKISSKSLAATPLILKSRADTVQYALGIYLAQWVLNNGFTVINPTIFLTGMDDMFKNRSRPLKDEAILPIITAYQQASLADRGKALEQQLFNTLKEKAGVGKLPSGVQYSILKAGKGPRPAETDSVVMNFKGMLPDGTVFEDTYAKKLTLVATPASLIPGLSEILPLMSVGSTWEIYIPSTLAYAEKGVNSIPPNSALIITIELIEIKGKK